MNYSHYSLELWRTSSLFLRSICTVLITCYLFVFYSPSVKAITHTEAPNLVTYTASEQLMLDLQSLQLTTEKYLGFAQHKAQQKQALAIYQRSVASLQDTLTQQQKASEKEIRKQLNLAVKEGDKAGIHLQNQLLTALLSNYRDIDNEITRVLAAEYSDNSPVSVAALALNKTLSSIKFGKAHHEYDNDTMPFGPLSSSVYKPAKNLEELLGNLNLDSGTQYSTLNEAKSEVTEKSAIKKSAFSIQQQNSAAKVTSVASTENLTFNVDNQVSPLLSELAQSLDNDPLNIYQYVYNNIEYVPAHGSIQGADYTAQTLRGGAMDQASLLISLLRISDIPARYVYGSINIEIEQAMNWVGNVSDANAVQNILSQGGVPNVLIGDSQGTIKQVNVEHVWVEAYVDDAWQAIDPSFKQYQYKEGINFQNVIELDEETTVNNLTAGADINNEGWVQNINQGAIETELSNIQEQIESYINQQYPDATVEDVLGSKAIIIDEQLSFPIALPYLNIVASQSLNELPATLRHKFGFDLKSEFGSTYFTFEQSLPELAGKRLALSFTPSTLEDEQKLLDYLPDNIESATDLPSQLPYGLFNVTANLTINEETVTSSSSSLLFGQELKGHKGFWEPRSGWDKKSSVVLAGEYQAIGIDTHGVSAKVVADTKNILESTKSAIETEVLDSITSHNTTGAIMQAGIQSYFISTAFQNKLAANAAHIINYRQPSYGTFGTSLSVSYFFGVPSKVNFGGVTMDVDRLADNSESKINCWNTWNDYNRQSGAMASYLENLVPEQLFSTDENPLDGISAIKALAVASNEGQKIYMLTASNTHLINEITMESSIRQEIQQALNSGKEVTIHQEPINAFGWTGTGYLIIDPDSGAGAYKISGGANGGALTTAMGGISAYLDGLTRFKDNWFNAGNAPLYAKISGVLTVISAVYSVVDTVTDSSLSVTDKILNIVMNIGSAIAVIGISQAVMANAFLVAANPLLLGVFLAVIAVTISLVVMDIMLRISLVHPKKHKVYV
ncbi:transglutaminase-like domain-containing protein [Pseudocolwellia agarivorans]|uniref:transglutaminase-like domain-containing protein n=1 Tax=Pseudocolwellia agarivorans TaxID=1911682 RepID=UPI003F883F54